MRNKPFSVRYTELAVADLSQAVNYVAGKLHNPTAARKLLAKIRTAVRKRSYCPIAFAVVPTHKKREHDYYRIYVDSFDVYYVVIDGVMEIRRILYNKRAYLQLLTKD